MQVFIGSKSFIVQFIVCTWTMQGQQVFLFFFKEDWKMSSPRLHLMLRVFCCCFFFAPEGGGRSSNQPNCSALARSLAGVNNHLHPTSLQPEVGGVGLRELVKLLQTYMLEPPVVEVYSRVS